MKRLLLSGGLLIFTATLVSAQAPSTVSPVSAHGAVIDKYCMGCHNDKTKTAGLSLADVDIAHPGAKTGTLEKVVLKLKSGMMPPAGMPRPDAATVNTFVASLEDAIKLATASPSPAFVIGGAALYAAAIPMAREMHLTELDEAVDGDVRFPAFDKSMWLLVNQHHHAKDERHAMSFRFCRYQHVPE